MPARQILVPNASHGRIAERLAAVGTDIEVLLWSPDGITLVDGSAVDDTAPEAAWIGIDLFFSGQFVDFVDSVIDLGSVRWVQGCLAGTDAHPFKRIMNAGIRLTSSDAPNAGVAEYVMSTVLQTVHGGVARVEAHRDRRWAQAPWREINGMTWLIVGFGSIGGELARRARAFGVNVVGIRRTAVEDDRADRMATMDHLRHELGGADVVVLACPLTGETHGLVDAGFLAAMRDDAILVNVSRGPVIDHADLLSALHAGCPATAILDVFDVEPLPDDSPLWDHPSIVLTSHVAGAGSGMVPRGDDVFLEHLDDYLAGRPLRLEVS
ncbi:MAG: D-2-hydroxyacid dehydrogenase [Actinomycetota bacterium]|nr:D-2-hydroxyacid dehydrogenase [Actinomycetota bacterium]